MVFSGLTFLLLFLPSLLILYFLSRDLRWRNGILVIFSLVFYAWGEPVMVLLLLATSTPLRQRRSLLKKYRMSRVGKNSSRNVSPEKTMIYQYTIIRLWRQISASPCLCPVVGRFFLEKKLVVKAVTRTMPTAMAKATMTVCRPYRRASPCRPPTRWCMVI